MKRQFFKGDSIDGFRPIPDMRKHGYYMTRCHTYFGFCPTYRHEKTGKLIYWYMGRFCLGPQVLTDLKDNWVPCGESEQRYANLAMHSELSVIFV